VSLYQVSPAKWDRIPAGARVWVQFRVPNPDLPPASEAGEMLNPADLTSTGLPALRLRTLGDNELLIVRDSIVGIHRQSRGN